MKIKTVRFLTQELCAKKKCFVKINFIKILSIEITTRGYDLQVEKKKILLLKTRANFTRAFSDLTVSLALYNNEGKEDGREKAAGEKGGRGKRRRHDPS